METIYCKNCKDIEAEYFWKEGKELIPICQDCAQKWALEELINNNDIIEFSNIDDEDIMEEFEKLTCLYNLKNKR